MVVLVLPIRVDIALHLLQTVFMRLVPVVPVLVVPILMETRIFYRTTSTVYRLERMCSLEIVEGQLPPLTAQKTDARPSITAILVCMLVMVTLYMLQEEKYRKHPSAMPIGTQGFADGDITAMLPFLARKYQKTGKQMDHLHRTCRYILIH